MEDLRGRDDYNSPTRRMRPVRQVDTGCLGCQKRIGATKAFEEVFADEGRGSKDKGDIAHNVVLLLVHLFGIEPRIWHQKSIGCSSY